MTKEKQLDGLIKKYNKVDYEYKNIDLKIGKALSFVKRRRKDAYIELIKHQEKIREMVKSLERYFYLNLDIDDDEIYERSLYYMGYNQTLEELDEMGKREFDRKKNLLQIKKQLKKEKEILVKEIGILTIKENQK